jgi:hypothetical protein
VGHRAAESLVCHRILSPDRILAARNRPLEVRALPHSSVRCVGYRAGVIGTVDGAQPAADGHAVSVLPHGTRTEEVAARSLLVRDASRCLLTLHARCAHISATACSGSSSTGVVGHKDRATAEPCCRRTVGVPRELGLAHPSVQLTHQKQCSTPIVRASVRGCWGRLRAESSPTVAS